MTNNDRLTLKTDIDLTAASADAPADIPVPVAREVMEDAVVSVERILQHTGIPNNMDEPSSVNPAENIDNKFIAEALGIVEPEDLGPLPGHIAIALPMFRNLFSERERAVVEGWLRLAC